MITHYCSDCGSTPRVWEDCCSPAQLDYENPQAVIDALREVDAALTLALKERDAYREVARKNWAANNLCGEVRRLSDKHPEILLDYWKSVDSQVDAEAQKLSSEGKK